MAQEEFLKSESCTIAWDTELNAATIEWHKFVKGDKFREGMTDLLNCAKENNATKQLSYAMKLDALDQDDKEWMLEEWTPNAIESGIEAIAVVYSESTIAAMSHGNIEERGKDASVDQFMTTNVEEAHQWLRDH